MRYTLTAQSSAQRAGFELLTVPDTSSSPLMVTSLEALLPAFAMPERAMLAPTSATAAVTPEVPRMLIRF
jgi:hypothetical protein